MTATNPIDALLAEKGVLLADGATGTLRLRMTTHKKGRRYLPCDSGVQTWSAR